MFNLIDDRQLLTFDSHHRTYYKEIIDLQENFVESIAFNEKTKVLHDQINDIKEIETIRTALRSIKESVEDIMTLKTWIITKLIPLIFAPKKLKKPQLLYIHLKDQKNFFISELGTIYKKLNEEERNFLTSLTHQQVFLLFSLDQEISESNAGNQKAKIIHKAVKHFKYNKIKVVSFLNFFFDRFSLKNYF